MSLTGSPKTGLRHVGSVQFWKVTFFEATVTHPQKVGVKMIRSWHVDFYADSNGTTPNFLRRTWKALCSAQNGRKRHFLGFFGILKIFIKSTEKKIENVATRDFGLGHGKTPYRFWSRPDYFPKSSMGAENCHFWPQNRSYHSGEALPEFGAHTNLGELFMLHPKKNVKKIAKNIDFFGTGADSNNIHLCEVKQ